MKPWLPADVARCRPGCASVQRETCGRFLAALPQSGGSVVDGVKCFAQAGGSCSGYMPASRCTVPPPPPRPRHPPLGS